MSRRAIVIVIALVLLGSVTFVIGLRGSISASVPTAAPTESSLIAPFSPIMAPKITGTTLTGRPFALADYVGTPIVLNFWASWCGPCRREIPAFAAFAKSHPAIQVIGINYQDTIDDAKAFARQTGATWPSVIDDGSIGNAYQVPGLPATYLIDAQGQIVGRILGEVTEAVLTAHVEQLLQP